MTDRDDDRDDAPPVQARTRREADITRAVAEGLAPYIGLPPRPPPPSDLTAEQIVASAAVTGFGHLDDLAPLQPDDFFGDVFRILFVVAREVRRCGHEPTDERLLSTLERMGFSGPDLARELSLLRHETVAIVHLSRFVERIQRAARRRRALVHVLAAETALRLPQPDEGSALEHLAAAASSLATPASADPEEAHGR